MTDARPTLVTAGTGKTGGRIVARLEERGRAVRAGSRRAEPPFDWHDGDTWGPALRGMSSVYVAYYPDAAFEGAAAVVGSFLEAATDAGVRHVVLLADRGSAEALRCEEAVRDSGLEWTVLRAGFINQNFSEGFLVEAIRSGVVALPLGDVAEPFVDADDIADVAVRALTEPRHGGQTYELTGPRLLTFPDAIAEIASQAGHPVRYQRISHHDFRSALVDRGVQLDYATQLGALLEEVFDGRRAELADGVTRALGRPAKDFSSYVQSTAATGTWASRRNR